MKLRVEDFFLMDEDEKQKYEFFDIVISGLVIEVGNKFFVIVVEVDMYVKVWSFYKKVVSDLECV